LDKDIPESKRIWPKDIKTISIPPSFNTKVNKFGWSKGNWMNNKDILDQIPKNHYKINQDGFNNMIKKYINTFPDNNNVRGYINNGYNKIYELLRKLLVVYDDNGKITSAYLFDTYVNVVNAVNAVNNNVNNAVAIINTNNGTKSIYRNKDNKFSTGANNANAADVDNDNVVKLVRYIPVNYTNKQTIYKFYNDSKNNIIKLISMMSGVANRIFKFGENDLITINVNHGNELSQASKNRINKEYKKYITNIYKYVNDGVMKDYFVGNNSIKPDSTMYYIKDGNTLKTYLSTGERIKHFDTVKFGSIILRGFIDNYSWYIVDERFNDDRMIKLSEVGTLHLDGNIVKNNIINKYIDYYVGGDAKYAQVYHDYTGLWMPNFIGHHMNIYKRSKNYITKFVSNVSSKGTKTIYSTAETTEIRGNIEERMYPDLIDRSNVTRDIIPLYLSYDNGIERVSDYKKAKEHFVWEYDKHPVIYKYSNKYNEKYETEESKNQYFSNVHKVIIESDTGPDKSGNNKSYIIPASFSNIKDSKHDDYISNFVNSEPGILSSNLPIKDVITKIKGREIDNNVSWRVAL